MKQLFTTEGRIPRSTFWKFFGFLYFLLFLAGWISERYGVPDPAKIILVLCFFPLSLLGIIVQIKRWHDRDKSGWWVLINFIPYIGAIWSLIECGLLPGTPGTNRFGYDPLPSKPPPIPFNY